MSDVAVFLIVFIVVLFIVSYLDPGDPPPVLA
jgi:hypothetical protein